MSEHEPARSAPARSAPKVSARRRRRLLAGGLSLTTVLTGTALGLVATGADAATVTSASFGGTGTVLSGGVLYAKGGTPLTLTVITPTDIKCVDVSNAVTGHSVAPTVTSDGLRWQFAVTAPTNVADGQKTADVTATTKTNSQGACTGTPTVTTPRTRWTTPGPS